LHEEILKRLAAIEDTISKLPIAGIGHNKPPEAIEPLPLSGREVEEIRNYIAVVKAQPAAPAQLPTDVGLAATRQKFFAQKILD